MTREDESSNATVKVADWYKSRDELSAIRRIVFIDEQKVPEDMEWDEHDEASTHFIATLGDNIIATARLKPDGQIGRMAVLTEYRNKGIGSKLLQYVLQSVNPLKIKHVYLHAQVSAIPFYEKHGFITLGDEFLEADIPHREMRFKT